MLETIQNANPLRICSSSTLLHPFSYFLFNHCQLSVKNILKIIKETALTVIGPVQE